MPNTSLTLTRFGRRGPARSLGAHPAPALGQGTVRD